MVVAESLTEGEVQRRARRRAANATCRRPHGSGACLLAACAGGLAATLSLTAGAQPALKARSFRLTYRAAVRQLSPEAKTLDLWLPYPRSDANQTIHRVRLSAPGPVSLGGEPRWGNTALHLRLERPALPMDVPIEVTMEVDATRRENAGLRADLPPDERTACLASEPLVPLTGAVLLLAREATAGRKDDAARARAIYDKVTGLMKYDKSGTGWGRGDALYACDAKRGNCTDFHALIIGMARSQGIPARFSIGLSLPEQRGRGKIAGYHCWAELYVAGRGWIPVDSSEAAKAIAAGRPERKEYYFGHHDENRIELSRGRQLVLNPKQQGAPLNYFVDPYAEVDGKPFEGKPFEGIERHVDFVDLPAPGE
jgi:transglutaminase-like putative cysteine protease